MKAGVHQSAGRAQPSLRLRGLSREPIVVADGLSQNATLSYPSATRKKRRPITLPSTGSGSTGIRSPTGSFGSLWG